jgi:hypothetical protein
MGRGNITYILAAFDMMQICKAGHADFFVSPQIANTQILGLIPQSQTANLFADLVELFYFHEAHTKQAFRKRNQEGFQCRNFYS